MFITDIITQLHATFGSGFTGPFSTTTEYIVGGYYEPSDGGGGVFVWIEPASGPLPPDDTGIVVHNANRTVGYFKRIYSGPINVRWFGAIISTASGLSNVTTQVHRARDASFAGNGTLYFPQDVQRVVSGSPAVTTWVPIPYVGNFVFWNQNGSIVMNAINLLGDGLGSVLKSSGAVDSSGDPLPILTLGWHNPDWAMTRISNITIDGSDRNAPFGRFCDGVRFDDNSDYVPATPYPQFAGKWTFENVLFKRCRKAVYKPNGNIGNSFINCTWESNEYGYYAEGYNGSTYPMHSGLDKFIGGHLRGSYYSGIFIKCSREWYGQLIIDGTTIEGNTGFGILIRMSDLSQIPYCSVELRNIWFESNGAALGNPQTIPIDIDGVVYNPNELLDMQFEHVRGVALHNSGLVGIRLIDSSVNLYNCMSSNFTHYVVDVDSTSSLIADQLRNYKNVSEKIFVNSIGYDGTFDIVKDNSVPTSVWGPLRIATQTGTRQIQISERFDQLASYLFIEANGWPSLGTTSVVGGVLSNISALLDIGPNSVYYLDNSEITLYSNETAYYVWSIHTYVCDYHPLSTFSVGGAITTADASVVLGQVIFKPGQWACSYGLKKWVGDPNDPNPSYPLSLYFVGNLAGGKFKIADYQVVKFDNLYDAQSFLNSRVFAEGEATCGEGEG